MSHSFRLAASAAALLCSSLAQAGNLTIESWRVDDKGLWEEVLLPAFAKAATGGPVTGPAAKPRRMFAICNNLGLLGDQFFPQASGRDYALSPYLKLLEPHRRDFSVFSGVSHPNVDGGHPADICFLTAAPHPGSSSFRNTISLDQHIAEQIGIHTRFPSLTLGVNTRSRSLSWNCRASGEQRSK